MSATLTVKDSITRTAFTTIDGVRIAQYTARIDSADPNNMTVSGIIKLDQEAYKANREICRADYAEFEDATYELQEKYIAQKAAETESEVTE